MMQLLLASGKIFDQQGDIHFQKRNEPYFHVSYATKIKVRASHKTNCVTYLVPNITMNKFIWNLYYLKYQLCSMFIVFQKIFILPMWEILPEIQGSSSVLV